MERITVNMVPGGPLEVCHASQFDIGREIMYDLVAGTSPFTLDGTETVTLKISKPDGTSIEDAIPNTSDSYVIWTSIEGDCDIAGVAECEIKVTKGGDLLGSGNFVMVVEADAYNGANIRTLSVGPADICTFETTLPEPLQSVLVNVLATGGNGTPDNPNPIVGYSSANITRCGVNLFDKTVCQIGKNWNGTAMAYSIASGNILAKANKYKFSVSNMPEFSSLTVVGLDASKSYLSTLTPDNNVITISSPDIKYIKLSIRAANTHTWTQTELDNSKIQLEVGETATTYHAYTGNTYTIAFGQTVYGGVLDVTRGKLHVTWGDVDLGTLDYSYDTAGSYPVFFTEGIKGLCKTTPSVSTCKCSIFGTITNRTRTELREIATDNIICITSGGNTGCIAIRNDTYTDAPTFKTAMDGVRFIYELATPFDIDLTPVQMRALVGENNVFADCGQTTVEYLDEG